MSNRTLSTNQNSPMPSHEPSKVRQQTTLQSQASSTERENYASQRAQFLFDQYPNARVNNKEGYLAGIALILSDYPVETIHFVTDPRTGIASNPPVDKRGNVWTKVPDPAHVKTACETHYGPVRSAILMQRQTQDALREREEREREESRGDRPTYDDLVARCAEKGLMIGPNRGKVSMAPLSQEAFCKQFDINPADFVKLPDQPKHTFKTLK